MCAKTVYVNDHVHRHYGRPPKRNPALQAFAAAQMLREGWPGIDTAVKAAAATDVTLAAVKAAQNILESGDEKLAADVLQGWEPLSPAAMRDTEEILRTEIVALKVDSEQAIVEGKQKLNQLSARLADFKRRLASFEPAPNSKGRQP